MATNDDSFVITAAMLAMAYVKPAITFTTVAGTATTTNVYLPATTAEYAGARGGVSAAVSTDPNYAFAITAEGPAVECNATLSVPTVV
jgi:putative aminopeptidase FrvX